MSNDELREAEWFRN